MRHLNYKKRDSIEFIDGIISSAGRHKSDTQEDKYKERCAALRKNHQQYIKSYDTAFDNDNFNNVVQNHPMLSDKEKADMLELYNYRKVQIQRLKDDVLTDDGYENPYCPLCEANLANTMDHYLPKSRYQLLTIHPKNLIPCCTDCNGHKTATEIVQNGKRIYWNAYLDTPPDREYIQCTIDLDENGLPKASFSLFQNGIEDELFEKMRLTINAAKILNTYQKVANKDIRDITQKVLSRVAIHGCTVEDAIQYVLDLDKESLVEPYGWENALIEALGKSQSFVDFVKQEYYSEGNKNSH